MPCAWDGVGHLILLWGRQYYYPYFTDKWKKWGEALRWVRVSDLLKLAQRQREFTPKESGSRIPVFSTMLLPDCPPNMNSLALILLYTLAEYRIIESHVLEIKWLEWIKTFIGSFVTPHSPFHHPLDISNPCSCDDQNISRNCKMSPGREKSFSVENHSPRAMPVMLDGLAHVMTVQPLVAVWF